MSDGDHISPWMPITDQVLLAILGKMGEESGELATRCCRCIVQGLDELDPDTGRTNRAELAREMADVMACIEIVRYDLPSTGPGKLPGITPDMGRVAAKTSGFRRWHQMIRDKINEALFGIV